MNKAIVSFAEGKNFCEMLDVARPTFYKYAQKNNYDVLIPEISTVQTICSSYGWDYSRPTSWLKVAIIKKALEIYDFVLWLDSDIIINKFDIDITDYTTKDSIQAFTIHRDLYEGFVPNCGVWLLNKSANELLDLIWKQERFINHYWWEQAANMHLMNWQPKTNNQNLSDYGLKSTELPYEFNVHKNDIRFNENSIKNGIFLHATTWDNRLEKMKEWVTLND